MEENLCSRLGGCNGISKRSVGFHEGKEEVVVVADDDCSAVDRGIDCNVEWIGSCPFYLYLVLRGDHDESDGCSQNDPRPCPRCTCLPHHLGGEVAALACDGISRDISQTKSTSRSDCEDLVEIIRVYRHVHVENHTINGFFCITHAPCDVLPRVQPRDDQVLF